MNATKEGEERERDSVHNPTKGAIYAFGYAYAVCSCRVDRNSCVLCCVPGRRLSVAQPSKAKRKAALVPWGRASRCFWFHNLSGRPREAASSASLPMRELINWSCPLYSQKQTSLSTIRDVRFVPKADSCTAANSRLFDHLVGNGQHTGRNGEAKRPRSFQIDHELKLGRLDDRQVCWLKPTRVSIFRDAHRI